MAFQKKLRIRLNQGVGVLPTGIAKNFYRWKPVLQKTARGFPRANQHAHGMRRRDFSNGREDMDPPNHHNANWCFRCTGNSPAPVLHARRGIPQMNSADWLPNNADLDMMLWSMSVALCLLTAGRDLDIVKKLSLRNIAISDREVAFLGKKFIVYLALAHAEAP